MCSEKTTPYSAWLKAKGVGVDKVLALQACVCFFWPLWDVVFLQCINVYMSILPVYSDYGSLVLRGPTVLRGQSHAWSMSWYDHDHVVLPTR